MRRMKTLFVSALSLAAVMALCSCGSSEVAERPGAGEGGLSVDTVDTVDTSKIADTITDAEDSSEGDLSGVHTFTLTAAGDCTLGVTQEQSYEDSFNEYYDNYGEDYFFDGVRDIFEADDMTVVNLECVLTTATERMEKRFNLKGAPEYVGILTGSSVEACSLANNHTMDYDTEGFDETVGVLEEAGVTYAYAAQPGIYVTDDGITVGIIAINFIDEPSWPADEAEVVEPQFEELRDAGAQIVIACCHWGIETKHYPTDFQQETGHAFIDAGADLVLGCHPHVLQGVEVYNGKVICYSLGNFCFGGNKNPSDKNTMIYQQTFTLVDGELQDGDIDANIIPCRISSANGYNDFHPTVAEGDTKADIISLVNDYSSPWGTASFDDDGTLITE